MWIVKTQNPATLPQKHLTSVPNPVCGSSTPPTSTNEIGQGCPKISVYVAFKFSLLKSAPSIAPSNLEIGQLGLGYGGEGEVGRVWKDKTEENGVEEGGERSMYLGI
ncbi:hypothetical protein DVH24_035975 [Malus domestica]|uniref:Uncharacterized protein n=1 Tax=Malus domestica TaxID=3750 RepID=A0A498JQW3_MALDO|nr:hypothetical protein DVH24_035975 [Malus domestica]